MIWPLRPLLPMALSIALLFGTGVGYWYGRITSTHQQTSPTPKGVAAHSGRGPVATVTVVPLKRQRFEEHFTAYGTTEAAPGESQRFSVPYECLVNKVRVTVGQKVQSGMPLVEIQPSQETKLQLDSARQERNTAGQQFKLIQKRLQINLATRQALLQAKQVLKAAQLRVQSLEGRGAARLTILRAGSPGVVNVTPVREGQIVPAGTPLVETIDENKIVVRLGVEQEDVALVQIGQAVQLVPIYQSEPRPVEGRIRLIAQQVNPSTRLVDVLVAPRPQARLLLNEYVRGKIVIEARQSFVVPRQAVVPVESGFLLYTVAHGIAVAHQVRIRLETARQVEVLGKTLQEGQLVVVVGNSQLRNGMAVTITPTT